MTEPLFSLDTLLQDTIGGLDRAADEHRPAPAIEEVGTVAEVGSGIARVTGFTSLRDHELVQLPGGLVGLAASIDTRSAGIILLGDDSGLCAGDEVTRTGRVVDVLVGEELLGRVVDASGRPVDERGPIDTVHRWPVERPAPPIMDRAPVSVPLLTGIKAIDAAIPIGRGQRELILGDRQTGKTAIAISAILNQRDADTVCVYCAIGQRGSAIARVIDQLRRGGAMDYTVVVAAAGDDPPGLQYIAPYAATSIAEFFTAAGRDVLIVYDDLTRHARTWRELSLLLRRPPGREAYPGDIFYLHSRLLERATRLRPEHGGGSLTALPIIETQAQNIAAYIPTNLISITDGQIYLSPQLFQRGQLPAIDIGLSVSRVGGKAQLPAYRTVAGDLRLAYAQFEELEVFARFGTRLDQRTERSLQRGWRVREILKQTAQELVSAPEQIVVLLAATRGLFDTVPLARVSEAEQALRRATADKLGDIAARIHASEKLSDIDCEAIVDAARALIAPFTEGHAAEQADGNA